MIDVAVTKICIKLKIDVGYFTFLCAHMHVDIVLPFLEFDYGTVTSKMVKTIPPQIEADAEETNMAEYGQYYAAGCCSEVWI